MKRFTLIVSVLLCAFSPIATLQAEVRLANIFSDHMVLQRQQTIKIWGWAEPGQPIIVKLDDASASTVADNGGHWQVELPPKEAGGPFEISIATDPHGKPQLVIHDVLIGDVWLCSGQSNMEFRVDQGDDARKEIANAHFPQIRQIKIRRNPATSPQKDVLPSPWLVCSPKTVGSFTGVGYFFGRTLHQELGVPIGLINSSWGGTRIEPWTPPVGFKQVPALADIYQQVERETPGTPEYQKQMEHFIASTEAWLALAKNQFNGGPVVPPPPFPQTLGVKPNRQHPTHLYNGMIHGFVGFPIRGVIWYQGEANRADGMMYYEKMKALIQGWRTIWKQGDFPFYYVQIAPFQYGNESPHLLPRLWEAQTKALTLPHTGMVVISDVGNLRNIHPTNKQTVGKRLAHLALKNDYGRSELITSGPTFDSLEVTDGKLILTMSNVADGLKSRDGQPLNWFEIIGPGTSFQKATATISGNTIMLTSPQVPHPTAMRFGWHKLAEPNLINSAGLPASPFRAGTIPSLLDSIPEAKDYQLVYDMNLAQLKANIHYDVDQSNQIKAFDRIAYFVELQKGNNPPRYVFVSMDAFTSDIHKIGIPTVASKASFQQAVKSVSVVSNVEGLKTGNELAGRIEFYPNNYQPTNTQNVPGASDKLYDFGDTPVSPTNGYGSMQVHLPNAKQTVFAINHWTMGKKADLGIGPCRGKQPDWTFSGNAGTYTQKRLRVLVRPAKSR